MRITLCASFIEHYALALAMAVTLFHVSPSAADDAQRTRLMTEAPKAWKKIVDAANHSTITRVDRMRTGDEETTMEWTAKSNQGNCLVETTIITPEGKHLGNVYCRNSEYSFILKRNGLEGPWTVSYFGTGKGSRVDDYLQQLSFDTFFARQISVGPTYLPDVIAKESFVIKNVEIVEQDVGPLVEVTFEYKPSGDERPVRWASGGVFVLNPAMCWAIDNYRIEVVLANGKGHRRDQLKYKYQLSEGGIPLIADKNGTIAIDGIAPMTVGETRTTELGLVPESEFRLPAFGLPEIASPSTFAKYRLLIFLILAGMVCVALAVLVHRRSRASV